MMKTLTTIVGFIRSFAIFEFKASYTSMQLWNDACKNHAKLSYLRFMENCWFNSGFNFLNSFFYSQVSSYHDACAEELYNVFLPEVGDIFQRFFGIHPFLAFQCVVQLSDVWGTTFVTNGLNQSVVCPSSWKNWSH